MLEPFTYRGLFWLPFDAETKLSGTLSFSQEQVELDLLGTFGEFGPLQAGVPHDRILGHSSDGKALTLERCHPTGSQFSTSGLATSRYQPSYVLVGAWFEEGEEVAFDELELRYSDLDEWVTTSGFTVTLPSGDSKDEPEFSVAFKSPEPLRVSLPDDELEITFSSSLGGLGPVTTEVRVTQSAALTIRFQGTTSLKRALEYTYQLRNFLGLAVGRPVHPLAIRGRILPPADEKPDPFTRREPRPLTVGVFYRLSPTPEVGRKRHPHEMLFTLAQARPRLQTLLHNWFAKQELLRPVFDLYFGTIYNRHSYLDQTFLSLMQALETYHRRTSPATEMTDDQHEVRLSAILDAVPAEQRDWLEGKLAYSNELSLRRRVKDVLGRCPTIVARLVDKRAAFVNALLDARNYLTHYDRSLDDVPTHVLNG